MKKDIHPQYFPKAKVHCACGNIFTLGSTSEEISVDICSRCHPFYTGKEKLLDTAGRVERFKSRKLKAEAPRADKKMPTHRPARRKFTEGGSLGAGGRGSLRRPQRATVKKKG